jgi:ABC-2 type transport system permease protein
MTGQGGTWWRQVRALMHKELLQLLKDRALLVFTIFIFTADILLAAGATSIDLHHARIAVVDPGLQAAGRDLAGRLREPYFDLQYHGPAEQPALQLLERGEVRAVLVLPPDLQQSLMRGRAADLQLLVDAAQANQGFLVATYTARIAAAFGADWAGQAAHRAAVAPRPLPQVVAELRYGANQTLDERWFNTISELLTMLTIAAIVLPAAALVREKERGTVEQLLVAPLTPLQVVLSKVLAMVLVMLAGSAVAVLGVMHAGLGVPVRGSALLFFTVVAVYAMACAGVGIVASGFARTSGQMGLIVVLLVVPIVMLSGTWNMVESMPPWLRGLVELSPLRHFVVLAYGILLRGAGLAQLWLPLLEMTALGALLFAVGVLRFRRQFR